MRETVHFLTTFRRMLVEKNGTSITIHHNKCIHFAHFHLRYIKTTSGQRASIQLFPLTASRSGAGEVVCYFSATLPAAHLILFLSLHWRLSNTSSYKWVPSLVLHLPVAFSVNIAWLAIMTIHVFDVHGSHDCKLAPPPLNCLKLICPRDNNCTRSWYCWRMANIIESQLITRSFRCCVT